MHVHLQLEGNVDAFPIPIWAAVIISLFLVPLSGLFAGLTLGLLSLDRVGLRVRMRAPGHRTSCQNLHPGHYCCKMIYVWSASKAWVDSTQHQMAPFKSAIS